MENINKHKTWLVLLGGIILGLLIAMCCFGGMGMMWKDRDGKGMHKMSDGRMMHDSMMNMDMGSMMNGMMMGLEGKTGEDFDKAFIKEMVIHHEGAVKMAELALVNGKHSEIKTLASAIISAQNKEISDMKAWYKLWFKEDLK